MTIGDKCPYCYPLSSTISYESRMKIPPFVHKMLHRTLAKCRKYMLC